jgi:hypothetical protein
LKRERELSLKVARPTGVQSEAVVPDIVEVVVAEIPRNHFDVEVEKSVQPRTNTGSAAEPRS